MGRSKSQGKKNNEVIDFISFLKLFHKNMILLVYFDSISLVLKYSIQLSICTGLQQFTDLKSGFFFSF